MVVTADDKIKSSLMRDGSHLKYTRSYAGAGAGLMAGGFMLGVMGALIGAMLFFMDMMFQGLVVVAISCVIGAIMVVPGVLMKAKRLNAYMDYYVERSGYSREMLEEFDREFANGTVMLFSPGRTLSTENKRDAAVLTDHWFKLPYMLPLKYSGLHRVEDMAAVFYEAKPYINGQKYDPLLFTVNSSGEGYYCKSPNREFAESLVSEIAKRNPGVITVRKITVDGKNYDCVTQPAEVAALFRAAREG